MVPFALELGDDDLVDVEEAVLLEADVDERGLHPGQHVVDGAQVDVPGDRAPVRALEVDLGDLVVLEDGDAALGDAGRDEQLALRGRERRPLGLLAAPAARPGGAVLLLAPLARGLLARWLLLGLPGASPVGDSALSASAVAVAGLRLRLRPPRVPRRRVRCAGPSVAASSAAWGSGSGGASAGGAGCVSACCCSSSCFLRRRNQLSGKRNLLLVCARADSHAAAGAARAARHQCVTNLRHCLPRG